MHALEIPNDKTLLDATDDETLLPRTRNDLLVPLVAHLERTRGPVPIPSDGVSDAFRPLRARWEVLDRFVGEAIERTLSGELALTEEIELEDGPDVRRALYQLAPRDPLTARAYLDAFDYLEGALAILRRFLRALGRGAAE